MLKSAIERLTAGRWTACSQSCGQGIQTREVKCSHRSANGAVTTVADTLCEDEGAVKPAEARTCSLQSCTYAKALFSRGQLVAVSPLGLPAPVMQAGIHLLPEYLSRKQELSLTSAPSADTSNAASGPRLGWRQGLPSAWNSGAWADCKAVELESAFGTQARIVNCVDVVTGTIRPEAACHPHLKPNTSRSCFARPLCSSTSNAGPQKCVGSALCGDDGCKCTDGQTGVLCQIPAACGTVQNFRLECCSTSAISAVTGECCLEGEVLDASGGCCSGQLDACGKCHGDAINVDIQGACCTGTLDGQGLCCSSNDVDECGICGGQNACVSVVRV